MSLLGQTGLKRVAEINHANAVMLAEMLADVAGVEVLNQSFFNEFTVRLKGNAVHCVEQLAARGIMAGVPVSRLLPDAGLDDLLVVANTEVNSDEDRLALVAALKEVV
jgi:glycine dehydrogenase subunit 1